MVIQGLNSQRFIDRKSVNERILKPALHDTLQIWLKHWIQHLRHLANIFDSWLMANVSSTRFGERLIQCWLLHKFSPSNDKLSTYKILQEKCLEIKWRQ